MPPTKAPLGTGLSFDMETPQWRHAIIEALSQIRCHSTATLDLQKKKPRHGGFGAAPALL